MITESLNTKKQLTIKDIAKLAGVSKTAVSGILNQKPRVCESKQKKVLDIIKKYDYVPQVSARALSMRRTYQIGYLVSAKATLGLGNACFATIQAGVSEACKKYGYQMVVSTYDLSSIRNFLMPQKLKQRSIDAIVIVGSVCKDVLIQLKTLNIPYIIIGGRYDKDVLCLRPDMRSTYLKMLKYFADLGHHLIGFGSSNRIVAKSFMEAIEAQPAGKLKAIYVSQDETDEFVTGIKLAQNWLMANKSKRYTAFIANDQICIGFLSVLSKNHIKCPDEISVMACSDTILCKWNSLPVSAAGFFAEKYGFIAAELLIYLLDNKKDISEIKEVLLREYKSNELIIRSTTGICPDKGG